MLKGNRVSRFGLVLAWSAFLFAGFAWPQFQPVGLWTYDGTTLAPVVDPASISIPDELGLVETTAPAAEETDTILLWAEDDGAGGTDFWIMADDPTGGTAVQLYDADIQGIGGTASNFVGNQFVALDQVVGGGAGVADPSLTFLGQTSDGFYSSGADSIGVTIDGALTYVFDASSGFDTRTGESLGNISFPWGDFYSSGAATLIERSTPSNSVDSCRLYTKANGADSDLYAVCDDGATGADVGIIVGGAIAGGGSTLAAVLAGGNQTGGTDILVDDLDQILAGDGTAGSPSAPEYSFGGSETDHGMYLKNNASSAQIGWSVKGTAELTLNADRLAPASYGSVSLGHSSLPFLDGSFDNWVRGGNETAGAPTFSFWNDTDTGIYRAGADWIGFATNGVKRVSISNNGLNLEGFQIIGGGPDCWEATFNNEGSPYTNATSTPSPPSGLTVTPGAGEFNVVCTAELNTTGGSSDTAVGYLYLNAVQDATSKVRRSLSGGGGEFGSWTTQARVTATAGQAIDCRFALVSAATTLQIAHAKLSVCETYAAN